MLPGPYKAVRAIDDCITKKIALLHVVDKAHTSRFIGNLLGQYEYPYKHCKRSLKLLDKISEASWKADRDSRPVLRNLVDIDTFSQAESIIEEHPFKEWFDEEIALWKQKSLE